MTTSMARRGLPEAPGGEISLQSPPLLPKGSNSGAMQLMMFLPMMLGMGAMSFVYIGRSGGAMTYVFGALFLSCMVGMIVMSLARGGAQKKAQINTERRDYQRYLGGLRQRVRDIAETQAIVLGTGAPRPTDLWAYVDRGRYWDRKRSDPEFGRVRLGTGPQLLSTPLRPPQTVPLEDLDPVSSAALRHFIRAYATVPDLPVALSLRSFATVDISGDRARTLAMVRSVLSQLATFHSPEDLAVALCVAPERHADWEWAKWLPHAQATPSAGNPARDATGTVRLVSDNLTALAELLGPDVGQRPAFTRAGAQGFDYRHVVVVVDGGRTYGDNTLAGDRGRFGVTVLDVSGSAPLTNPPPETLCLHVAGDRMGRLTGGEDDQKIVMLGRPDDFEPAAAEALSRALAPLYAGAPVVSDSPMAAALGLPGLLGIGDPRDLDVDITWQRRPPRDRLRIPIGIDPEGRPVALDIKESAEGGSGPHGLVIGATGSGKSELLRTLVIGLAATHSSEGLNLALIDFKGGATFAGMTGLPHTCAVITNLSDDLALVDRMGDAINGEMVRRQELLRAAGNYASVRDYERARETGANLTPLPSLLVIIDEFSELLSNRPDFIDLFVMIGRLGRSLGIHLLLASQRLEEGRLRGLDSHLSYRVGLRTFSASESRSVLGVPDAYQLPSVPGSAYLKIDTETMIRLRAAYVSGELPPRDVTLTDNNSGRGAVQVFGLGTATGQQLAKPEELQKQRDELSVLPQAAANGETIMDAMVSRMMNKGPSAHQIWLPPLDEPPTLEHLLTPLGVDPERGLCPVGWGGNGGLVVPVALVDKPFEQRRDQLWADFSGAAGHAIVVGAPQTGKSTLLRSLVSVLSLTHTPREVQFFLLDMGGGGLAPVSPLPHVSGYASRRDAQSCRRMVAELVTLLQQRELFFSQHGIDSMATFRQRRAEFRESGADNREFGDVFLVVDDWATLRAEYEVLEQPIINLAARGLGFGIHVVVSANWWMGVRPQLRDAMGTRFELRLGDPGDSLMDRRAARNVPEDRPGRGITKEKLHFLTALPRIDGDQRATTVAAGTTDLITKVGEAWQQPSAPRMRLLPQRVEVTELIGAGTDPGGRAIPLGVAESDLKPVYLDFGSDPHFIAFGDVECGKSNLLRTVAAGITSRYTPKEAAVVVVDYRRGLLDAVSGDHLLGYAGAEPVLTGLMSDCAKAMQARLPGPDVTADQLRSRSWWTGPELFVLVDDYELVATAGRNPLIPLLEYLPQSRDIGLHIVACRASGGASRGLFEPVLQRVRELGSPGLVMSGDKDEGALLGSVKGSPQPQGRGTLVRRRSGPELVQVAWTPPAS